VSTRQGRCLTTDDLPIGYHRQGDLRLQCLVGVHISAVDRQRLEAFIRRSDRSGFFPANLPIFAELCLAADEKLFETRPDSSLRYRRSFTYLLTLSDTIITFYINSCRHNPKRLNTTIFDNADITFLDLPARISHLADFSWIQRIPYHTTLYHDVYWRIYFY